MKIVPLVLCFIALCALSSFLPTFQQTELLRSDSSASVPSNDGVLNELLDAPQMEAERDGEQAKKFEKQAERESQIMAKARTDEEAAKRLVERLKSQLESSSLSRSSINVPTPPALEELPETSLASAFSAKGVNTPASENQLSQPPVAFPVEGITQLDGWKIRRALNSARVASKRAAEAKVIEQNELAIARSQADLIARLRAQQVAVRDQALGVEARMQSTDADRRQAKSDLFHSTMDTYTGQLQQFVAQDMDTLGHLKVAESMAAVGPHVSNGLWSQVPTPSDTPDIDPEHIMSNAPFRTQNDLAEYKIAGPLSTTQLAENHIGGGGLEKDSMGRVMAQEEKQLNRLTQMASSPSQESEAAIFPASLGMLSAMGSPAKARKLQGSISSGHFTSFAKAAKGGEGHRILDAKVPVGLVRIPLGRHEDGHMRRLARVSVPAQTLVDHSPGSMAVRADGSHWASAAAAAGDESKLEVHMPHVA